MVHDQTLSDLVLEFYSNIKKDKNHRYKSWEHCFNAFQTSKDFDYLSLHLAFYLASWGMMRGSSGLLWKDYKIHVRTVEIIKDKKFEPISFYGYKGIEKDQIELILEAHQELSDYYKSIKYYIKASSENISPTDTLISKILLGTIGCIPAFDRLAILGLKESNINYRSFTKSTLNNLFDFVIKEIDGFHTAQSIINKNDCFYPIMKIVDMYLWQIGFNKELHMKQSKELVNYL